MLWLFIPALLIAPLPPVVFFMRRQSQSRFDSSRKTYLLTFPTDLGEDQVKAWLGSISGVLKPTTILQGTETIVFETWANARGIVHRMHVPKNEADYIANQLRSLIPGLTVAEDTERPVEEWKYVLEIGMSKPSRKLRITSNKNMAASLLASVQALDPDETLVTQWILGPAIREPLPSKEIATQSHDFNVVSTLNGQQLALNDEIEERRQKLSEHNLLALGRVAAVAKTEDKAKHLANRVVKALAGANSHSNYFRTKGAKRKTGVAQVNDASAPLLFPAQFAISELAAVLAWPIGQPFVAGLPLGSTRHLHATEDIPRDGRILGHSNFPGAERPIAIDYHHAGQHLYIGGKTGTGKTVMMANGAAQDMAKGYGVIVIDAGNSESNETLFSKTVSYIPRDRLDDVIIMDVNRNQDHPVGFNILDQGKPRIVVDQITSLFAHLYSDTNGVWVKELLFFGLYTLVETTGMTFADLMTLIMPRTKEEVAWADDLKRAVRDPEIKGFWQRWENYSQSERDRYSQPLVNRIWQLVGRPETRNIIGQSHSSFKMSEVLTGNKILLVSLAGMPPETASLLGTLLVNSLWTAAQAETPEKHNFLYLDEFQLMTKIPLGLDDMLARARKHKLGVVLATQYLEDVPAELKNAVINNARSRVIFQSSAKEARTWQQEFGRQYVDENDFTRIRKYEAIAQLATESGIGAPVTISSLAPLPITGVTTQAIRLSNEKYGRSVSNVKAEMYERRQPEKGVGKRPAIGVKEWDNDGSE